MILRLSITLLSLLLLLPSSLTATFPPPSAAQTRLSNGFRTSGSPAPERERHQRRVIVTYKRSASKAAKKRVRATVKAKHLRVIKPRHANTARELEVLTLPGDVSVETAVARLRRRPEVASVGPDRIYRALYTPNDPGFSPNQWHLRNTGQTIMGTPGIAGADVNAPEAWDRIHSGATTPVIVAVIDSGIDLTHPDLAANIWSHPGETAGNGIDDDGNGFIDDVQGHNWASLDQLDSFIKPDCRVPAVRRPTGLDSVDPDL